jgi:uncharacterized protein YPO0396
MTRKISLSQFHAINWYGYADSIPVSGNLLLAGVTGAGKSILMDLLQFVLVGDRRLVKFNQSATGAASARDLKGYVLGDIKEDEGGVTQYMRDSAITYAALEFTWPHDLREETERRETWGLRVEYSSAAEAQGHISPWWCPGRLQRGDFLATLASGKRAPRELADWRAFVEERGGEVFAGIEEYRRDMSSPGHLNFDHGILSRLLPTAIAFTFLKSFNDFCRLHILPADKLNIADVTTSYRTFQRYEEELVELRKQLDALREISAIHERHDELARDGALSGYLSAELSWENLVSLRSAAEAKYSELIAAAATEEARLRELDYSIPQRRDQISQIRDLIRQAPGGDTYLFIKSENEQLVTEIGKLRETGNSLESALALRLRGARTWAREVTKLPLELDDLIIGEVELAAQRAEAGGLPQADDMLRMLGEALRKAASEVSRAARPTLEPLAKLREELGTLREEVAALKLGVLPGESPLLNALNTTLLPLGKHLPAQHLCKLCEVTDERWRAAIEVAFTQKFGVVVASEHYDEAERIYHSLKADQFLRGARSESLINPVKALNEARPAKPGSLAEKIKAQHPVASALVGTLFGDLMCCERREELRRYDRAVLPDGFMARGAFVQRVRHYDNVPFVGQQGLRQQQAWKEKQITANEAQVRKLEPIERLVAEVQRNYREQFENPTPLSKQLAQISGLPALESKLEGNIKKLNLIDRKKFDEWEQQRAPLEIELKKWELEQRALLSNQKHKDVEGAEQSLKDAVSAEGEAKLKFDGIRDSHDFSGWVIRLEELRAGMLAEFTLEIATRRFTDLETKCTKDAAVKGAELIGKRELFVERFPKFDDLPVQAKDNAAYDRLLAKINDADIPNYEAKAKDERRKWEILFREQVLEKLRAALIEVKNIVSLLNTSLNKPIGSSRYFIEHRKNPDFEIYHRMLDATAAAGSDLFASIADEQLREQIGQFLELLVKTPDSVTAAELLDYRQYFKYDMLVEDTVLPPEQRRRISVDQQSGKFSGGENQSPYFIAILASYLRAYRRHDRYRDTPTLALVPIDEAFSKLSGERIADCMDALAQLDLQGVFSMSTGNIPYAFEKCDHLLVVSKDERRVGRKLKVRNVALSIARGSAEAREFMRDLA